MTASVLAALKLHANVESAVELCEGIPETSNGPLRTQCSGGSEPLS